MLSSAIVEIDRDRLEKSAEATKRRSLSLDEWYPERLFLTRGRYLSIRRIGIRVQPQSLPTTLSQIDTQRY